MRKLILITSAITGALCILMMSDQSPVDARPTAERGRLAQPAEAGTATGAEQKPATCSTPDAMTVERCKQLETSTLEVTLRLEMTVRQMDDKSSGKPDTVSIAHATVVGGRFLVTHNHFAHSPDEQNDSQLVTLSAYRADGTLAIRQAFPHTFHVFSAGPQTLVFDFGHYGGQGAFDYMGMASAQLGAWQTLGLRPGMEVAQVDWDGQKTHIDWVRVSSIDLDNGTPVLQLENYVAPGASGGGIFYAGYHIGNNWLREIDKEFNTGKTVGKRTVAALNDTSMIALAAGTAEPAETMTAPLPAGNLPRNLAPTDVVVR